MNKRQLNHTATWLILALCFFALVYMIHNDIMSNRSQDEQPPVDAPRELVNVDTTAEVIAYYPLFAKIDLVTGTMPAQEQQEVIFCAEAAFTHELLADFAHTNIDGDHVCSGKRFTGAKCKDNTGAFISWGNHWEFVQGDYSAALDKAAANGGMGFGQASIIHQVTTVRPLWRKGVNHYRALCEKQGQLCVVDSRQAVEYADFVAMLERYGVTEALYLDMGTGWNHSWWRQSDGTVHEIHPKLDKSRYCTNWITFIANHD